MRVCPIKKDIVRFDKNIAPTIEASRSLFSYVNFFNSVKDTRGKIVVFDATRRVWSFEQMTQLKNLNILNMITSQVTMNGLFTNDKVLESLTLRTRFRDSKGVTDLLDIQKTGNCMTDTGIVGWSSSELLKKYDRRQPGTYRWQVLLSSSVWAIY